MNYIQLILNSIDTLIFSALPIAIITLSIGKYVLKNRLVLNNSVKIIKWFIIGYSLIKLVLVLDTNGYVNEGNVLNSPNSLYTILVIVSILAPTLLFIKKLSKSLLALFILSIVIKIGSYFETCVILVTSLYRHLNGSSRSHILTTAAISLSIISICGIILGLVFIYIDRKKSQYLYPVIDDNL